MTRKVLTICGACLIAILLTSAVIGYDLGSSRQPASSEDQSRFADAAVIAQSRERYGTDPMVQDAIGRWTRKNGGTIAKAMSGYQIQVIAAPTMTCVKFAGIAYDVGGEPTYCYQPRTARMVWEDSEVE